MIDEGRVGSDARKDEGEDVEGVGGINGSRSGTRKSERDRAPADSAPDNPKVVFVNDNEC